MIGKKNQHFEYINFIWPHILWWKLCVQFFYENITAKLNKKGFWATIYKLILEGLICFGIILPQYYGHTA